MRLSFLLVFLGGFMLSISAQQQTKISVPLSAQVRVAEAPPDFNAHVQNLEMSNHFGDHYKAIIKSNRAALADKYPKRYDKQAPSALRGASPNAPTVNFKVEGNNHHGSVPNDNDVAISNAGILISVINSSFIYYDTKNQQQIASGWLNDYISHLNITSSKYDPKVIYDPDADRFIVIFLSGYTYQTSRIVVAFSSTNNPTDPWNVYILPGNSLANNTWSDYPVVGINKHDLFIGINTFFNGSQNNSGFHESCFWQVSLTEGYQGATNLNTLYYSDILQNQSAIFNITPMRGAREGYGPDMYLLSNRNIQASNDTIFVLHVSNTVASGNAQLSVTPVKSDLTYFLPPVGKQFNSDDLTLNDSRVLGGFYENGNIQFVQSCLDTSNGLGGIYHGFISGLPNSPSCTAQLISDTLKDLGFPNIASTAVNAGEEEAFIGFVYTSPLDSTGMGALYMDNYRQYSPLSIIKKGENAVNVLPSSPERWGDYSGIQRKYNEPCRVWFSGSFGKPGGHYGTYIGECFVDSICRVETPTEPEVVYNPGVLYPNPSSAGEFIYVDFLLDEDDFILATVYDMLGKRVAEIWEDGAKAGNNRITFNTLPLSQGAYILVLSSSTSGEKLLTKKFVVKK